MDLNTYQTMKRIILNCHGTKEELEFVEIEESEDKTYRDTKGFGSTGLKITSVFTPL